MAVRTLKAKYEARDDSTDLVRRVFCASKGQELYYQFEDEPEATSEPDLPPEVATPSPAPVAVAPTVVTPPLVPTAAAGLATSIEDAPICAVDILAAIVSQKLKSN
jgi:fatty acid synthase subunit alpha, fungi type